jgi:hypothetical protein
MQRIFVRFQSEKERSVSATAEYRTPESGLRADPGLRVLSTGYAGPGLKLADGLVRRIALALTDMGLSHTLARGGVRAEGGALIFELCPGRRADDFVVALEELALSVPAAVPAGHTSDPAQLTLFRGDAQ